MNEDQIKEYLREHDEEYRRLEQKHRQHKKQLEAMANKVFLSPEQQKEKKDIKKLKLKVKDQLQQIIINHSKQPEK